MTPQDLIKRKRDGKRLSPDDMHAFIDGVVSGTWTDYQVTAMVMAMFIRGLDVRERLLLTKEMVGSGEIINLSSIDRPIADKHSTGGVGDKTSLIVAPLAAACGLAVPMISGRGLGHTGGTLDKLESIPGYQVRISIPKFVSIVKQCGFAMVGQTKTIAPADRRMYALRDASGMVESIPLIVASILSKKLAESLDVLVLDVKTGSGAFMDTERKSRELAKALVETSKSLGVKAEACITSMDEPLGKFSGNALETYEALRILRGEADASMNSTTELSIALTARMLVLSGIFKDEKAAVGLCRRKLDSGEALELFRKNIILQGGNAKVCDRPGMLMDAKLKAFPIKAESAGYVSEIDARVIGEAIRQAGGGRDKSSDRIDPHVGFESVLTRGDRVKRGDTIGVLYCRKKVECERIGIRLQSAYRITAEKPKKRNLIRGTVS
jgi:pyrimidine-nucleoside phosphorylase